MVIHSAENNTTITGIETELTNGLRTELATETRLKPVRSEGDTELSTLIAAYDETPPTFRPDGKELTRLGTLRVQAKLEGARPRKVLWKKDFSASQNYNVTDTIAGTLTNRRKAISTMINDLVPRIHSTMFDNF